MLLRCSWRFLFPLLLLLPIFLSRLPVFLVVLDSLIEPDRLAVEMPPAGVENKMDTPESLQMLKKMADDPNEIVRNEALRYIDLRSKRQKKVEDHSG